MPDFIYLSPHLDDAALSCGGQIYQWTQSGRSVLIVTIAAGPPPPGPLSTLASSLHQRWKLAHNVVQQRRAEDIVACQLLGATYLHWEWPDCIYRRHPESGTPLYRSDAELFGPLHVAERPLLEEIAERLTTLPPAQQIVAPLAVGNHVDHQLARRAAERQFGQDALRYYEDYPYARRPGAVTAVVGEKESGWEKEVISLSDVDVAARIAAIAAYSSQLSSFFADHVDMAQQVRARVTAVSGERLWRRR